MYIDTPHVGVEAAFFFMSWFVTSEYNSWPVVVYFESDRSQTPPPPSPAPPAPSQSV